MNKLKGLNVSQLLASIGVIVLMFTGKLEWYYALVAFIYLIDFKLT